MSAELILPTSVQPPDTDVRAAAELAVTLLKRTYALSDYHEFIATLDGFGIRQDAAEWGLYRLARDGALFVYRPSMLTQVFPLPDSQITILISKTRDIYQWTWRALAASEEAIRDTPPQHKIPMSRRTEPMNLKEAARRMGYKSPNAGRKLRKAMNDGAVFFEQLGRQQYVFDKKAFPAKNKSKTD